MCVHDFILVGLSQVLCACVHGFIAYGFITTLWKLYAAMLDDMSLKYALAESFFTLVCSRSCAYLDLYLK